jgi:hypothetical protein
MTSLKLLCAIAAAVFVACASTTPTGHPDTSKVAAVKQRSRLEFRRQPDGVWPVDEPAPDFWNLDIDPTGLAILAAEGTPLIADGNYAGVVSDDLMLGLRKQVEQLEGNPKTVCTSGPTFLVLESPGAVYRQGCLGGIENSDLGDLYKAAQATIKAVSWRLVCARPQPR